MSPAVNRSLQGVIPIVLNEIRFFKYYAHHVATSDSCGEKLRDVYQIPSKRVHVIVNGVVHHKFRGEDSNFGHEFRFKIGVLKNANTVLGVAGRLVKDKGHPILHEAFSNLMASHPHVCLVVAGSGPCNKGTGIRANAIDIFVNLTLRPQGLDLTLMEAMMSGTPVMASRFPSIKGTIIVNEEFGFMFSPNVESLTEALELAVAEGAKRLAQRGKACRDYVASMFTARKMALAYERLFLCIKIATFCTYP
ncbi:hypothetical protein RJ640_028941 [Escallonia rubra]|uniref:Glycosyl transferase family 1 domain-containing protein n=1 Tax=Escallonia rubra TaxID=112253 RepID=A0AA88URI4_9ASTE|nr:hypothetical protein RJ640_028941 [Escallonia rubra]